MFEYIKGAELPDFTANFRDQSDAIVDMTSGWTFSVKVGKDGATTFTKSTGITGGSGPSVIVQWDTTGELNDIDPGVYVLEVTATRTADSRQRRRRTNLTIVDDLP